MSRLIVNPTKSSSSPIYRFIYCFLMHSIVFINAGLSPVSSVSSTYTITITVLSSCTLYNRPGLVLHCQNPALRFIVLMYHLNQQCAACIILQRYFIIVNISYYVQCSSSTSDIPSDIFIYISSYINAYKNTVSTSILWEYHLLINQIISMACSVMSVTAGEQFLVKSTLGIWLYPCANIRALKWPWGMYRQYDFLHNLGT